MVNTTTDFSYLQLQKQVRAQAKTYLALKKWGNRH